MTALIGIVGKAGVGKDTAAAFLVGQLGYKRFAFGDAVKAVAAILFNTAPDAFVTQDQKKVFDSRWQLTRRQMAQLVGTEMVRDVLGPDHWIKLLSTQISEQRHYRAVVTDVRFPNELDFILDRGGSIIHIESLSHRAEVPQHQSEQDLDMKRAIEYNSYTHIQNDGTMKELKNAVIEFAERQIYGGN